MAAHDKSCMMLECQCASKKPQSFLRGVCPVCSPVGGRWNNCKGVCPAAHTDAGAAITTAFSVQVTSQRVQYNRRLVWPCLGDSVAGLEGCGTSTWIKLADTYAHAAKLGVRVPDNVNMRQKVTTGQLYSHAFSQICSQCVLCLQVCCVSKCDACCFRSFISRNLHLLLHTLYSISRLPIFLTANSLYDDESTAVQFPGCALIGGIYLGRRHKIMKQMRGLQGCVSTVQLVE